MSNEDIIHIMNDKIERLEEENTQLKVALRSLYCIDSADPREWEWIRNRAKELFEKVK